MKIAILTLLLVGFVAASKVPKTRKEMLDLFESLDTRQEKSAEEGSGDSEEGSGEEKLPVDFCKALKFYTSRWYTPLTVDVINTFMTHAMSYTQMARAETVSAIQAAAAAKDTSDPALSLLKMAGAFAKGAARYPVGVVDGMFKGLGAGVYKMITEGVYGIADEMDCLSIGKFLLSLDWKNMTKVAEQLKDPVLQATFAESLLDDFKCLKADFDRMTADVDNFQNITVNSSSRAVAIEAFSMLYDAGHLRRDFHLILCSGQKLGYILNYLNNQTVPKPTDSGTTPVPKPTDVGTPPVPKPKGKGKGKAKGKAKAGKARAGKAKAGGRNIENETEEKRLLKLLMTALDTEE